MRSFVSSRLLVLCVASLALVLAWTARGTAQSVDPTSNQDHVVSAEALQLQVVTASAARQKNIDTLTDLLKTPTAEKAMRDAKVDPVQVKNAIPTLSDDELANLSGRVTKAQSDFSAGILGIGLFTLIILVVILIIVVAAVH